MKPLLLSQKKNEELGFKGATSYFLQKMRMQKEAWFVKGFDEDTLVGVDELGNKYWQSAYTTARMFVGS